MTLETRHLKEDVTHWPIAGSDGYGGFTFGTPVKLNGRWEGRKELFLAPDGEEAISRAVVYVSADVIEGDYLGLGDLTATADPTDIANTYRIRNYMKQSDLRNLQSIRKAFL